MDFRNIYITIILVFITGLSHAQINKYRDYYNTKRRQLDSIAKSNEAENKILYQSQKRCVSTNTIYSTGGQYIINVSKGLGFVYNGKMLYCYNMKINHKLWSKEYKFRTDQYILMAEDYIYLTCFNDTLKAINKSDGSLFWIHDRTRLVSQINSMYNCDPFIEKEDQLFEINKETGLLDSVFLPKKVRDISYYQNKILYQSVDGIYCFDRELKQNQWKSERNINANIYPVNDELILESRILDSIYVLNLNDGKIKNIISAPDYRNFFYATKYGYVKITKDECRFFNVEKPKFNTIYNLPSEEDYFSIPLGLGNSNCCKNDMLFLVSKKGIVRCFDTENGELLWDFDAIVPISSNLVVKDGILYFVTVLGTMVGLDINLIE